MSDRPSFLEELKRRKVVRVAIVYAAVTWAVLQVADIVLPALGLPEKLMTGLVVVLVLGFPVALGLAWAFDVTPTGVKRADKARSETDGTDAVTEGPITHSWVSVRTVAVAVVMLLAGWLGGRFLDGGAGGETAGAATTLDLPSVAVLPFRDLGTTADSVHFADGIQDDILTQLGRIDALRVTSRTSTEKYRDTEKDIPTIAGELKVRAVLEGGVQRTADRVHINVQLIDGATDKHLWAQTYDRALNADNVFAIQSEIARAVADALKAALTPDEEKALSEVPTHDMAALDLYHRGRSLIDSENSDDQSAAIPVLEEAVRRDPSFVRAWAELTRARSWQIRQGFEGDTLPARQALDRVVALAPGSIDANLAEGNYLYYARGDFAGALESFQRLSGAGAANADVAFFTGNVLRRLNRWDEAAERFTEAARLDPVNPRAYFDLAYTDQMRRRLDEAQSAAERAAQLAPDMEEAIAQQIDIALWGRGDSLRARALLPQLRAVARDGRPDLAAADLAFIHRDPRSMDLAAQVEVPGVTFQDYFLHPGGPVELWRAQMAWALGDTAGARSLSVGLEAALVKTMPVLAEGGPPAPDGEDLFGIKGSLHAMRGWVAAFNGDRKRALAEVDSAVSLYGPDQDPNDGTALLRQRALIRVVVGDAAGAVEDLRRLLEGPGLTTVWELRLDPFYDSLRGRKDFQELVGGGS
ncbi:MAG: tetratricopeptide repeat protein [Gemmatimonadetes bacterium]|nr:tetratricopeptide repeat protein [Gemmatimonadota bacterium]